MPTNAVCLIEPGFSCPATARERLQALTSTTAALSYSDAADFPPATQHSKTPLAGSAAVSISAIGPAVSISPIDIVALTARQSS